MVTFFVLLVGVVAVERVVELVISARNVAAAKRRGGVETGLGHYPVMVALHAALLAGAVAEVVLTDRPFLAWLSWPMLTLLIAAQALRWWCIATLGSQWNTRVVVVPGLPRVSHGPYRMLRHPNYLAVVVEGVALPLVHTAWLTAVLFSLANLLVLRTRIRCEERALRLLAPS